MSFIVFVCFFYRETCVTSYKILIVMTSLVLYTMEEKEQPYSRTLLGSLLLLKREQYVKYS
jgi:hypothetical protein